MKSLKWLLMGIVVGLPLAGWLTLSLQARSLGATLVADATALEARQFELPHNAPGLLIDCLGREADVAPDVSRTLAWSGSEVRAVTAGTLPTSALTTASRNELDLHRDWLARVEACGGLATVRGGGGIGAFADVRHGRRQSMPRLMESLTSLAPLTMRTALEAGRPDEALSTCAAVLTVSTAWLRLEGLEAMLATMGPARAVWPACDAALRDASPIAKQSFHQRLGDVRALAPDYAEVMRLERTQTGLRLFGAWLPQSLDAQLPPDARAITADQRASAWSRGVAATLALRLYWKKFDRGMREVEAAATLPAVEREAAMLRAQDKLAAPFLRRFLASDPLDLRYQMYAVYLDGLHARLDALTAHDE